jgi:predicted nucleic acid-binding protein
LVDTSAWIPLLRQRRRQAGVVVQSTDLLIATIAIRVGATLLHRDADFERIAQHSALKTEHHP